MTAAVTVETVLERARQAGALGPGPVSDQISHSRAFALAWESSTARAASGPPESFLDLGTGAGVPGLILAERWGGTEVVLLDARLSRITALASAIVELGWSGRVAAVHDRAEDYARAGQNRERFSLVVARGFASPAVTAESAAALVEVGGTVLVSEPPVDARRWDPGRLHDVGLEDAGTVTAGEAHIRVMRKTTATEARYPRRAAAQRRRPLW